MKLYLDRKMIFGFLVSIGVVLGLGVTSYLYFNEFLDFTRWATHSRKVLYHAEQVRSFAMEIETAQKGYGLTGNEVFLENYNGALNSIQSHLHELDSLTADNALQQNRIKHLHTVVMDRIDFANHVLAARKSSFEEARDMVLTLKGKKLMDEIKLLLTEIQEVENDLIIDRSQKARQQFEFFIFTFAGLVVFSLVSLVILIFIINSYLRSRMLVEKKLMEAESETQRVNKDLESFSYSVSHDLRAPLRSIVGYAQILKEDYGDKIDAEADRVIGVIIKNAKYMGQLIDDLLDFSRLGKREIRKAKIAMDDFVGVIVTDLLQQHGDRKIDMDMQTLMNCQADITMFKQVWINLLSNAIKYSQKKERAFIQIGCEERPTEIEYYIKDNGAGFDMQYQDKLFGVFQRLHKSSDFEGTGVGLALVKRILDRHNGKIWATARVNEGATFYFTIPK